MLAELKKARYPVETGLLLAFCLFLPLLEFWKNLALVSYAIAWLVNRMRSRDFGGPWRISDSLVLLWIGAAYLAATFAGLEGRAWAKTGDVAASALLFWMTLRAGYAERELRWLQGALLVSLLAGLAVGYVRMFGGIGKTGLLQLYSVGHVNHTAIYIAIMLGVCVSWLFAGWRAWPAAQRWAWLAFTVLVFASLAPTWSRAAIAAGALVILAIAAAWWPRWRLPLIASAAGIAVVGALLLGSGAEIVRKQAEYAATGNLLSFRSQIWSAGLVAWEKYPWFGIGKDNYPLLTADRIRAWSAQSGRAFDAATFVYTPHAHSLYVNTLVERGIAGFATLVAVLAAALLALLRHRPRPAEPDIAWLLWGGAAGAWIVTAGVGIVNTTLHHEHGLLAALLLGLWLSTQRERRES
jgi:O-antigen ligase